METVVGSRGRAGQVARAAQEGRGSGASPRERRTMLVVCGRRPSRDRRRGGPPGDPAENHQEAMRRMTMRNQTRRDFVKTTARAGGALGALGALGPLACAAPGDGDMAGGDWRTARPAAHPHPRRHPLHRPAPGQVRARPGPRGVDLHPRPDRAALLPRLLRARRAPDRRPQRRPGRAGGARVGRGDRQFGLDPALGGDVDRAAAGAGWPLPLRIVHFGVPPTSRRSASTRATRWGSCRRRTSRA